MNFLVLNCFQCSTYQVHQSKKSKKWICKLCGAKQSLVKVLFEGSSRECRKVVQEANLKKRDREVVCDVTNTEHAERCENTEEKNAYCDCESGVPFKKSKWESFKPTGNNEASDSEEEFSTFHQKNCPTAKKSLVKNYDFSIAKRKSIDKYDATNEDCLEDNSRKINFYQKRATDTLNKSSKWSQFR